MARKKTFGIFEIPGLDALREAQRIADSVRPPALQAYLETQRHIAAITRPAELAMRLANGYEIRSLDIFREFHAAQDNLQQVIQQLQKLRFNGFRLDDEDELEATEFELLPESQLILPEQKILIVKEITNIEKVIAAIYKDNQALYHVHHREFEEMIAELLRRQGFEVQLTKQTRDGGKDIIALYNQSGFPLKFLVECKKHSAQRKIGVDIIRSFSHVVMKQNANKGIIVTSSYFSSDAQAYQQETMGSLLDLRDHTDVIKWVRSYVEN